MDAMVMVMCVSGNEYFFVSVTLFLIAFRLVWLFLCVLIYLCYLFKKRPWAECVSADDGRDGDVRVC